MSLAALMRHWTRPGAVKEFHIGLPPGRQAQHALRQEVQVLHEALLGVEVVEVEDVVDVFLVHSTRSKEAPLRLRGLHGAFGRVQARRQYLGLAYGFEAGLAMHAKRVRGREEDSWNPEGKHWSTTRQILVHYDGLKECLGALYPEAEAAWSAVLVNLLDELGQHPALRDMVDYMLVHGQRQSTLCFKGNSVIDPPRWMAWNLVRGFVLGADIIAHHATGPAASRASIWQRFWRRGQ